MAVLPPAPGVTRVVLNYLTNGVPTANVLHFTMGDGPDGPDPEQIATQIKNWWSSAVRSQVGVHHILQNVVATDLGSEGAPGFEYSEGLPLAGGKVDAPCSNNVALVVSWRTGLRGKSFRGRTYTLGYCEDQTTGNNINPATVTTVKSAWDQLIVLSGLPLEADYNLCILSYYTGKALRPAPIATRVLSSQVNSLIDTQRRRMS